MATPRQPVPPPTKRCACGDVFRRGENQSDHSWRRTLACDPCGKKNGRGKPFGTPNRQEPVFDPPAGVARDWRDRAACLGEDSETFFALSNDWTGRADADKVVAAKAICARCPSRAACLDDAVASGDAWSIRGGLTPQERRQLRNLAVAS